MGTVTARIAEIFEKNIKRIAGFIFNVGLVDSQSGNAVSVQYPLAVNGDSVYVKDLDLTRCSIGTFTGGTIEDLFNDLNSELFDISNTNPKTILVYFNRPIATTGIAIGNTNGGTHSNLKIEALRGGNIWTTVRDNSTSAVPFNSRFYSISAISGNDVISPISVTALRITFNTTNTISLSNITINKINGVQASLIGLNPDGITTYIGATRYSNLKISIQEYGDTAAIDAFARLRTSNPFTIADSKQLYDKQPLFWDEVLSGVDATSVHSTADAEVKMGVGLTAGEYVIRQTKQRFNYQPGKSQLFFMTFHSEQKDGAIKRIGAFDGTSTDYMTPKNGVFLEVDGDAYFCIAKNGATVERVAQANWNVDKLDGTGKSGITLDLDAAQILVMDLEWLGVGRVRVGFVINGLPYYCHYFNHANDPQFQTVYMSTPNLPIRYDILSDGTGNPADAEAWTPVEITTQGWYDFSDTSTITHTGGVVSVVADKSGNGNNMTPPGGGEPITGVLTQNGLNVLTFNGSQRLRSNNGFSWPTSGNLMCISVQQINTVDSTSDSIFGFNTTTQPVEFEADNASQFNGNIDFINAGNTDTPMTGGPWSTYFMSSIVFDWSNNDINGYIDGTLKTSGTGNYTTQITDGAGTRSMTLFGNYNSGNMPAGYGAEYVFVDANDTTTRQLVEGYLAWKWGIQAQLPAGHPYENDYPRTGSVTHLSHICSTVISEGGVEETGLQRSVDNGITPISAGTAGITYVCLGIRLKDTHIDTTIIPQSISMIATSNNNYRWSLLLNPTLSSSLSYSDLNNSAVQTAVGTGQTVSNVGVKIASGYASSTAREISEALNTALRIGATIARVMDQLIVAITPINNNTSILSSLTWRELL